LAPTGADQTRWAQQVKVLPATPIVGHVLARHAQHSIETLHSELQSTHAHKRSIIVPITIPNEFVRYLNSAQKRSLGPHDDNASGIDFAMRTIGRKFDKKMKVAGGEVRGVSGVDDDRVADGDEGVDEDDGSASEDEPVVGPPKTDMPVDKMLDPSLMSASQLQQVFGDRAADLSSVFFQHSTRIAAPAEFLPRASFFMWRPSDRAGLRRYAKGQAREAESSSIRVCGSRYMCEDGTVDGARAIESNQVHPSVYISALRSSLASSNLALNQNEVLVDLTGGTPEIVIAAIVVGFKKVFFVGDDNEHVMMQLPVQDEQVDWTQCPPAVMGHGSPQA